MTKTKKLRIKLVQVTLAERIEAHVHMPVIGVVFGGVRSGVHVISNQPVEVTVAANTQLLHLILGEMQAIGTEIPEDHNVLKRMGNLL